MAHTSKHLDLTVTCLVVRNNKVLLVFNKRYGSWFPPGGHIDEDESPDMTLYREMEEETGLGKKDLELVDFRDSLPGEDIFSDMEGYSFPTPAFTDIHEAGKGHKHVGFRYFFKAKKDFTGSTDKYVTKLRWFSRKDLDDKKYDLRKHVRYYAKYALKNI